VSPEKKMSWHHRGNASSCVRNSCCSYPPLSLAMKRASGSIIADVNRYSVIGNVENPR
jgi:hypothetical protein